MSHIPAPVGTPPESAANPFARAVDRRSFLRYTGATALVGGLALAGCKKDTDDPKPDTRVNLGSGDIGILNYAYALEQLEAAFYEAVLKGSYYTNASPGEKAILKDIRDHEVIHREFFKKAIPVASRIKDLTPNFSTVNFGDRMSVLTTAKALEDTGVGAYNGAGPLFSAAGGAYLLLAGEIVSVEARHAALIADLLVEGSFANTADANGLDPANSVADTLNAAKGFITDVLNGDNVGK